MRWTSVLSELPDFDAALAAVLAGIDDSLGTAPDLVVILVSPHHAARWNELAGRIVARWPDATVVGASGAGVIGEGREVEQRSALALSAALLPGASLRTFRLEPTTLPADADADAWRAALGLPAPDPVALLLLPEPFGGQAHRLVAGLGAAFPACAIFGGVASGAPFPGGSALFVGADVVALGAVGVAFYGALTVEVVVSQGCRPVGPAMLVTAANGAEITGLQGEAPREVLRKIYDELPPSDRELFRRSLLIGVEAEPESTRHREGDYLARNIRGLDAATGALTVAERLDPWQVVQFLVRDGHAADADLRQRLERHRQRRPEAPGGALLFACVGRGLAMFGTPQHDTDLVEEYLGPVPLAGLFCHGEIGPVGGRAHVHGYTAVLALFYEAPPEA